MGIIKDIKEIKTTVKKIDNSLTEKNRIKAEKYDQLINYLSKISLKIDKIVEGIDDFGNTKYYITYKTPELTQEFDYNGEAIPNDFLIAVNMTNLLPIEDTIILSNIYEKEKNKKSKKNS